MMPAIRAWSVRTVLAAAVIACGGGGDGGGGGITPPPPPPPPSGSASVTLGAASFSPSSVSITRNGTVTWNNTSGLDHNVTFASTAGAPANITTHNSGSNQRSFATAGTFSYSCTLHAGMNGTVAVQ